MTQGALAQHIRPLLQSCNTADITGAAIITGAAEAITAGDFMQVMSPVRMARLTLEASIADPSGESPTPFCGQ
jgi:hypothetical protein